MEIIGNLSLDIKLVTDQLRQLGRSPRAKRDRVEVEKPRRAPASLEKSARSYQTQKLGIENKPKKNKPKNGKTNQKKQTVRAVIVELILVPYTSSFRLKPEKSPREDRLPMFHVTKRLKA